MLNNFIYSKTKALFEEALNNGEVLDEAIVFIEDTKEIWNHGIYFDGKNIDLTNYETIERSVLRLLEAKTYTDEQIKLYHSETLTINLGTGTSWVSFYVQTTLEELQTELGTNGITITTSYDGNTTLVTSTYDSETNTWSGDLTELDFTKMYQIECSADCSITLSGKKVGNIEITLAPGWNSIGYPVSQNVEINVALSGLTPSTGDQISSKDGFATYLNNLWIGSLQTLEPGKGYKYYNSGEIKTLRFPAESEILKSKLSQKQDIISDLDTIREGSALGATAVDDTINSFDTKVITLKISLKKGWNWYSSYLNVTSSDLTTAVGTNATQIKGQTQADGFMDYVPEFNSWSGTLTIDFAKMYMINTTQACEIYLTGEQINPSNVEIVLDPNAYSYISYPLNVELSITEALVNLTPTEGDTISNNDGLIITYTNELWSTEFTTLVPGQGYTYYSNNTETVTFTYPDTYYKPFGNVEVTSELGESTTKAASLDLVTKVSEESKQYVDDKIDGLNKVTLTIDLAAGVNWVSFYVNITLEELQNSLGTNGVSISTTSTGGLSEADLVNTYTDGVWSGNITNLDFSKMYEIKVTEAATIEVSGELLNPEDIIITLNPGWNHIGYPLQQSNNLTAALAELNPQEGDQIKSKCSGVSYYDATYGIWYGQLKSLVPGEGYMYRNTSGEIKTFKFPTELDIELSKKLDILVSGTNIKTVNGESILGSGDITIESGTEQIQVDWNETDTTSKSYIVNKPNIIVNSNHCIYVSELELPSEIGLMATSAIGPIGITARMNSISWCGYNGQNNVTYTITNAGDGTKFLSDDGTYKSISTQYPIIEYASDNTTVTISPNVFHVWGEVVDLNIEFNDPEDYSVLNEYIFQFASGSTAPALSLPENLMWTGGEAPVIESNTIYQISIVNKCATVLAFPVTV